MRTTLAILSAAVLLVGAPVLAQQAVDPTVTLKLPRSAVQTIGNALMKAPYETSAPILLEMQRQLNEAEQAKGPPTAGGTPTPANPPTPPEPAPGQMNPAARPHPAEPAPKNQ